MSTQIVEFNQFEADLAEYKGRYAGVVYDFADKAQEKRARSDRLAIGKTVAELDRVHKAVKAPLQEKVALLDGERKRIKDGLLEVQNGIKQQIARHEAEQQAIADALEAKVQAIKEMVHLPDGEATSQHIRAKLAALDSLVIDEAYSHRQDEAADEVVRARHILERMLPDAEKREAQEAENARLKAELAAKDQAERDEQIAREAREAAEREAIAAKVREEEALKAAEQAKADAARAALEAEERAAEAAKQAEIDKAAAIEQARLDQERRQREEIERAEAEAARRKADKEHRVAINKAALAALIEHAHLDEDAGKSVVMAIAQGKIPAISISY